MGVNPTILAIDTFLWLGYTVILTGALITLRGKDQYQVLRGEEFSPSCYVASDVTFSHYEWYFTQEGSVNRTLIRFASTRTRDKYYVTIQLSFKNVTFSDTGIYTCEVTSSNGTYGKSLSLTVHDKPTVTVYESNYSIGIGDNLTVRCSIDGNGSTVTRVNWKKETSTSLKYVQHSKRIFFNSSSPSLIINDVRLDDAGKYTCIGQTAFGTTESSQISVQIFSKPDILVPAHEYRVRKGTAVSLQIKVQTQTSSSIQWEKFKEENQQWFPFQNNSRLSWTYFNPSLNILTALVEDDGKYRISVKTEFHELTSPTITLTVYVPVKIKELSTKPAVIHEGDKVEIRCVADGRPEPKVTWKFANGTMNSFGHAQGNILVLERVTHSNEGNYTCKAHNNFSEDQTLIFLTIIPVLSQQVTDLTGSPFENYLIPSVSVFVSVALISLIVVIILIRRKRHPVHTANLPNSNTRRISNGHEDLSPLDNISSGTDYEQLHINLSGDITYDQMIRNSNNGDDGNNIGNTNISSHNVHFKGSNKETDTSQVHMNVNTTYEAVQQHSITSVLNTDTKSENTQVTGTEEMNDTQAMFISKGHYAKSSDIIRAEPSTTAYEEVVVFDR